VKNSQYVNGFAINISEISRICFSEMINNETTEVSTVCMHLEMMRELAKFINNTIAEHDTKQMENKKTLS
jgi:hypothetical protein